MLERLLNGDVRGEPVFREEDCSPFDIGLVYSTIARFSDADKFRSIQNIWKADVGYEFPVSLETGRKHRKFKPEWLVRFPWLAYWKYVDGASFLYAVCLLWYGVWKEWFQAG